MKTEIAFKLFCSLFVGLLLVSCKPSSNEHKGSEQQAIESEMTTSENDIPFYIGTYTRKEGHVDGKAQGIHLAFFNPETGSLRVRETFEAGINPSYLAIHPTQKFLYAVNEIGGTPDQPDGLVSAFTINEDYSLTVLNSKSTRGIAPCHLSLSNQGSHLFVANYVSGNITSFPIGIDGQLAGAQTVINYKGKGPTSRQKTPHAHFIKQLPDDLVITADLGSDSIRLHRFESGQLSFDRQSLATVPGAGPRHIEMHPALPILYVVNELNATVSSFRTNADGAYHPFQKISTLPEDADGEGHCAAIKITSNGQFLYVSNRGDFNNIAIYNLDEEGVLTLAGHQSSLGNVPRAIALSPDDQFLLVANQDSDNLVSFQIDPKSGLLRRPVVLNEVATPVSLQFFDFR